MDKAICGKCKREVPITELAWRNKAKGIRHARCKACMRIASQEHYQANKEHYRLRNVRLRKAVGEYLREVKNVPCMDCGQTYPYYVMDFDHVRGEKLIEVGSMRSYGSSLASVKKEVFKCDVVCSNCHRVRTFSRSVV